MVLSNPNHSVISAPLCSCRAGSSTAPAQSLGRSRRSNPPALGAVAVFDVPVAVCELCVCVSVTVCVHLSLLDASPRRLQAGFTPLFQKT